MAYTTVALKEKIVEMYPEIERHHLLVGIQFSDPENAYIISFKRGSEMLTTRLEKKDADECMLGIKCVYLGVQVAQFISNFEARAEFARAAA